MVVHNTKVLYQMIHDIMFKLICLMNKKFLDLEVRMILMRVIIRKSNVLQIKVTEIANFGVVAKGFG